MGAYLDTPIKDKNPEQGKNDMCSWGVCSMQGWRVNMEDAHISEKIQLVGNKQGMLFAVFDGHGGAEVADYAKEQFIRIFKETKSYQTQEYDKALSETFLNLDDEMRSKDLGMDAGATSCVVLITENKIICANSGDSRAVLCKKESEAIGLSEDHKPENPQEMKRIEAAGHYVQASRVDGNLALSRALGDFMYKERKELSPEKQAVTVVPDVTIRDRTKDDMFIMVACDGIWDCLTNQQLVDKINQKLDSKGSKSDNYLWPVEEMFEEICAKNTDEVAGTDNMTAILVKLFNDNLP